MPLLSTTRRKVAVGAAAVAVAALGGAGGAVAATSATAASPSTPATAAVATSAKTGAHRAPRWLRRADHASVELRRNGHWVTIELDRGKVTAVSATSITIRRPDGTTVSFAVTPATKVHGVASVTSVAVGDPAWVLSEAGKALRIGQHAASTATPPSATSSSAGA